MSAFAMDDLRLVPQRKPEDGAACVNVFSVDVEEWFQVGAFETTFSRDDWPSLESRVDYQTGIILDVLAQLQVKATFFCLGWVAKQSPNLIAAIANAGHEVACHGMDHQRVFRFTPDQFLADIVAAKSLLEDAGGSKVNGYRAPSFSMSADTWAHYEKLAEAGFSYSSSIVPAKTDHYGAVGLPRVPFYPLKTSSLIEVPMTVAAFGKKTVPASGGGYFRLLPQFVSGWLSNRARRQTGVGTIFYMHPWEMDPDQPYISHAPFLSRFRHYTGQGAMRAKITALLSQRKYMCMDSFLEEFYEVASTDGS